MKSKFDLLYNSSFLSLFNEKAPDPSLPDEENENDLPPEDVAVPKNIPNPSPEGNPQQPQPPVENGSMLPDPRAQTRVGIDALNAIIELFQKAPNEQKNVIERLKEIAGVNGINESNFKDALAALRTISPDITI